MDNLTPELRSKQMSLVRSNDTKPEWIVRHLVYNLGYRYRLHRKDLPGKPDLVFRPRQKVIFVNGCFWHGHRCRLGRMPKSRLDYWQNKIARNRARDTEHLRQLRRLDWSALVLWECQLRDNDTLCSQVCGEFYLPLYVVPHHHNHISRREVLNHGD